MKKFNKFSIAALLAAGALVFGLASCDTGNDEYNPEVPTTYKSYATTGNDVSVTAKWDFSTLSASSVGSWSGVISTAESVIDKEIKPSSGAKAKLVPGGKNGLKGKSNVAKATGSEVGCLQTSAGTCSLSDLGNAYSFILTTEGQTNIKVSLTGAGAADAKRLIAIYKADDKGAQTGDVIVSKGALSSAKVTDIQVQGAPAGSYLVYVNGVSIYSIDCSSDSSISVPAQIDELKIDSTNLTTLEATIDTFKLTANNVKADNSKDDLTLDCVWTSSNTAVATVKDGTVTAVGEGSAVIRARNGRYYDEVTVEVKACTSFVVNGERVTNSTPQVVIEKGAEKEFVVAPSDASVTIEPSDLAKYENGKIKGLKSGTGKIKLSKSGYTTTEISLKIQGTLVEVESWDFTKITTAPTSPVAGKNNKFTLVKGASTKGTNFTRKQVTDSSSGAEIANGLIVRENSAGSGDAAYIDFTGDDTEYTVVIDYYDNTGSATKYLTLKVGAADATKVNGNTTKDFYSTEVQVTGEKFQFGGNGSDGFIVTKITIKAEQ